MNMLIGVPWKYQFSRILFSMYLRYGSLTHCGRLQKNMNVGIGEPLSMVTYFMRTNLPLLAGGGYAEITSSITVLSCDVGMMR